MLDQRNREVFVQLWFNSAKVITINDKHVEKHNGTSHETHKPTAMAKRTITRACRNSQSRKSRLSSRKASFRKPQRKHVEGCAGRWEKDADCRKCVQENSRAYETMESWDQVARGPQKNPQNDATAKAVPKPVVGCSFGPQTEDPTRFPRVNILNLDKFTALAWMITRRSG